MLLLSISQQMQSLRYRFQYDLIEVHNFQQPDLTLIFLTRTNSSMAVLCSNSIPRCSIKFIFRVLKLTPITKQLLKSCGNIYNLLLSPVHNIQRQLRLIHIENIQMEINYYQHYRSK